MKNGAIIGNVVAKEEGKFEWMVRSFSALPRRKGAFFSSPEFYAEGEKWRLRVYPNGAGGDTWLGILLVRTFSRNRKSISCTVGIKQGDHSEDTIGTQTLIHISVLYTFKKTRRELQDGGRLPDDQLTITCLIEASPGDETSMPRDIREHSESAIDKDSRRDAIKPPKAKDEMLLPPEITPENATQTKNIDENNPDDDACTSSGANAPLPDLSSEPTNRVGLARSATENGQVIGRVIATSQRSCKWIIPSFSKLPRRRGAFFYSPTFDCAGSTWWMKTFPNGIDDSKSSARIHTNLHRLGLTAKYVRCTVGLERADGSRETIGTATCGNFFYCEYALRRTREELERGDCLPSDNLAITCHFREAEEYNATEDDMILSPDSASEDSKSATHTKNIDETNPSQDASTSSEAKGAARLIENMRELLTKENEDFDVRILVRGQEFRAHKCILKARSPVFRMILTHDCKEKKSGDIHIDDCDPECFEEFLHFVYCGRAENLTQDKAPHLYYAADKYDFPDLKEQCVQCMKTSLSATSVCDVVLLAVQYEESELLRTATEYFAENTKKILLTVEWQNFIAKNPVAANELFIKALKTRGANLTHNPIRESPNNPIDV